MRKAWNQFKDCPDGQISQRVKNALNSNSPLVVEMFMSQLLTDRDQNEYYGLVSRPNETIDCLIGCIIDYIPDFALNITGPLPSDGAAESSKQLALLQLSAEAIRVYSEVFTASFEDRIDDYYHSGELSESKLNLLRDIQIAHFNKLIIQTAVTQSAYDLELCRPGMDIERFLTDHSELFKKALFDICDTYVIYGFTPFEAEDVFEENFFHLPVNVVKEIYEEDLEDRYEEEAYFQFSAKMEAILASNMMILNGQHELKNMLADQNDKLDALLADKRKLH